MFLLHDNRNFIQNFYVIFDIFMAIFHNEWWFGRKRKNLGLLFLPCYFMFFIDSFE